MGKNKQGWTCMEDSDWADMHAKQTIKQSHTQSTNKKYNLAFLFFAAGRGYTA